MSRLDDELQKAFRREQPSADFAARVLERVAQQPAPRPRWWQRLATLVEPPKLRWIAIGVTASLLLAIGAAQYNKLHRVVVDDRGKVSKVTPHPDETQIDTVNADGNKPRQEAPAPAPRQNNRRASSASLNHRLALARAAKERELRAEGEAAKEKLMLALSIASAALNDAQKAIHDDGPKR